MTKFESAIFNDAFDTEIIEANLLRRRLRQKIIDYRMARLSVLRR